MIDFLMAKILKKNYSCKHCARYAEPEGLLNRGGSGFCTVSKKMANGAKVYVPANIDDNICLKFKKRK